MIATETLQQKEALRRMIKTRTLPGKIAWEDYKHINGWGNDIPMRYELAKEYGIPIEFIGEDPNGDSIYECKKLRFTFRRYTIP